MAGNGAWFALAVETAEPRAYHHNTGQCAPAADTVDHRGAGEIDKTHLGEPAIAVPGPVAEQRVDKAGNHHCTAQITHVAGAFRHGPGGDGGGGSGEHDLEQEHGPGAGVSLVEHELILPEPAIAAGAEHQPEAHGPEHQSANTQVHVVLHDHVQ